MSNYNFKEIQDAIELVCVEKNLDLEEVIATIESAIAGAYRKDFGQKEFSYQSKFDLNTGKYTVYRVMYVVEEVLNPNQQLSLIDARLTNPSAMIGDVIKTDMEVDKQIGFGRLATQVAKQVLTQSIQSVRHGKIIQQFKDRIGDIVSLEIDYFSKGGYYAKLAQTNVYLSKENILPIDKFKSGNIIKALIVNIVTDIHGNSKIILSRSHPDFIKAIIKNEVPEVANGLVTIDKIAREPGSRSKILVSCDEGEQLDPVGTILGKRNMRIINIMRQISSSMQEKIDVIENQPFYPDLMIVDALEPAQIEKVTINHEEKTADVYCHKDEGPIAVGRRGINIKLAEEITGFQLNLITFEDNEVNHSSSDDDSETESYSISID